MLYPITKNENLKYQTDFFLLKVRYEFLKKYLSLIMLFSLSLKEAFWCILFNNF